MPREWTEKARFPAVPGASQIWPQSPHTGLHTSSTYNCAGETPAVPGASQISPSIGRPGPSRLQPNTSAGEKPAAPGASPIRPPIGTHGHSRLQATHKSRRDAGGPRSIADPAPYRHARALTPPGNTQEPARRRRSQEHRRFSPNRRARALTPPGNTQGPAVPGASPIFAQSARTGPHTSRQHTRAGETPAGPGFRRNCSNSPHVPVLI